MRGPTAVTLGGPGRRRGVLALALGLGMMAVVFTLLMGFTLGLVAAALRVDHAWAAAQALSAAEAGLDLALQGGGPVSGQCGAAWYAARTEGDRVTALGQVELASGTVLRRAVSARRGAGGGYARGTWQAVLPAAVPDLAQVLADRAREAQGP